MGSVRTYREGDEVDLAGRLRAADLAEIRAGGFDSPSEALRISAAMSEVSCTIIGNHGHVAGMFGIGNEGSFGRVWLLGSDELVTRPLVTQFLRQCPKYLDVMARPFERIGNVVLAANAVHLRWLLFMGFSFTGTVLRGVAGDQFLEFYKVIRPEPVRSITER